MKKLNLITPILYCLILFITSCGASDNKTNDGSITATSVDEVEKTAKSVAEGEVAIGNQVWTSKNLDVSIFKNGEEIPEAETKDQWKAFSEANEAAWCYYENITENGVPIRIGKLYNWFAVNDPRGLAPKGYHIPTDKEWSTLTEYLRVKIIALSAKDKITKSSVRIIKEKHGSLTGATMKSTNGWKNNGSGTNTSGFSGLPGGCRGSDGSFGSIGNIGFWWSSSESSGNEAWYLSLSDGGFVIRSSYGKQSGFSVRCLRD